MSSYLKYLKYKTKYIELKKIYNGGGEKTARNYFIRNLLNNPDMFTIFRENLQSDIDNELINTGVVINKENLELLFNSFYHKLLEKNTTNLKTDRYIDFFIKSYLNNKFGEGKSSIQNMDRFIDYIPDHDILKNRFPHNTPPLETFNDDLIELEKFLKPLKPEIEKIKLSKLGKKVGKMEPIFETEDVLVYNPKTTEQAIAYGMQTKWCTASRHNKEYFYRYSKNGVLCYAINKNDGDKYGLFYDMQNSELSIWDAPDRRIDSVESSIPFEIMSNTYKFMKNEKPNYTYFSDLEKEKCDKYYSEVKMEEPIPTVDYEEGQNQFDLDISFLKYCNVFILHFNLIIKSKR
jgi:hypothetical protein